MLRTPVTPLPFGIGRHSRQGLSLDAPGVSQQHAEIFARNGGLWLRDLASTNGTFLNRQRLAEPARLAEGDILHFADQEFRLVAADVTAESVKMGTLQLQDMDLPRRLLGSARELHHLIEVSGFTVLYQPIVDLASGEVMGYETLCRGTHEGLPAHPAELLALATSVDLEEEVSRAFRRRAVTQARGVGIGPRLFVNTHPHELRHPPALLESVGAAAGDGDDTGPQLVLEIHEAAVTDPASMAELHRGLREVGVELAYDDFGAGRARLLELIEVPPDYLKFDISMIRGLDRASEGKLRSLATLVAMARELGITSVAEGIEHGEEKEAAQQLGFDLGQGYLFGRPEPR